jgi:hypothetical protein
VKRVLLDAFRREFPEETVDVDDGYADNIHVVVVSKRFDKMTERRKQDLMWTIVDRTPLTEQEKQLISLLYPVALAEIR